VQLLPFVSAHLIVEFPSLPLLYHNPVKVKTFHPKLHNVNKT
jgi:hypothetical protein